MGRNPRETGELPFVFEGNGLKVMPTQICAVVRSPIFARAGLDQTKIVHGGQRVELHRPLPAAAELIATSWVSDVQDKGAGKGALVVAITEVSLAASPGDLLCTLTSAVFARGDGGVGGPARAATEVQVPPSRAPDHVANFPTSPDQALLYRLTGDRNPLHASPAFAARAGFAAPILHGLCTYGIACKEILASLCGYDPAAIESYDARFTAPVLPGEQLRTEIWVEGSDVFFISSIEACGTVVLNHGRCTLRPDRSSAGLAPN